jgi:hypothetical protein
MVWMACFLKKSTHDWHESLEIDNIDLERKKRLHNIGKFQTVWIPDLTLKDFKESSHAHCWFQGCDLDNQWSN